MYVVCVHVHVKPEYAEAFLEASLANARATTREPGNLRFDVLRRTDDPNRFMLFEVYRDERGMDAHKATAHYAQCRETVESWMAEPRLGVKYAAVFPEGDSAWKAVLPPS